MKKVTVRDIVHRFAKLNQSLKPGETIEVTLHGKPIGRYTKTPHHPIKMPNFYEELRKFGGDPKVGDALLKRLLAEDEIIY